MACLIDTNVIVYARDEGPSWKRDRAREVLRHCAETRAGMLSTQVLIETFDIVSRTAAGAPNPAAALEHVGRLAVTFPVLPANSQTVLLAADCARSHGLRIFDAMLWAAAVLGGAGSVLTEDLADGTTIDGVAFVDPFRPERSVAECVRA